MNNSKKLTSYTFILIALLSANSIFAGKCNEYLMSKIKISLDVIETPYKKTLQIFDNSNAYGKLLNQISKLFTKTLKLDELSEVIFKLKELEKIERPYYGKLAEAFALKSTSKGIPLNTLPTDRPIIFYANHPLSGADAFAILAEIEKVRPDIKAMAANYLESLPGFKERNFIVNISKSEEAKIANRKVIANIHDHITSGGSLLIFPAGSVSSWQDGNRLKAIDPKWHQGFLKFVNDAENLEYRPIFIEGEPSQTYLKLRENYTALSNAYVFRELANQIGTSIGFTMGEAVLPRDFIHLEQEDQILYLREILYRLEQ